jgi:hypothetical protein
MATSKGEWVPTDMPLEIADALLSLPGDQLQFPVLRAIVNAPIVLGDGTIHQTIGHNEKTQLYYDPYDAKFPRVLAHPTKDEALKALAKLKYPFRLYPFRLRKGETQDRSVALSVTLAYAITIVNRLAYPRVPGFAFNGNRPRVGKGKLVKAGSILATGRGAAVFPYSDGEEFDKTLRTRMLDGVNHIAIDNVDRPLDSALLNAIMTEDTIFIRSFGVLSGSEVPNSYILTITGNKLVFVGDLTGRWLQADIVSLSERPELESFDFDPVDYVTVNRGELVSAALTVIKGYIEAGRPSGKVTFGSFEDWSNDVRGALLWLGEPDPVASMEDVRSKDPEANLLARFLNIFVELFDDRSLRTSQLIDEARGQHTPGEDDDRPLLDLLGEICDGEINSRTLGDWLRKKVEMTVDGKSLYQGEDKKRKISKWKVSVAGVKTDLFEK